MFDTPSLFDSMELDDTQRRVASRRALALAHNRVEHYLGAFLRGAKTAEEFDARLALVQEDFDGYVSTAAAEMGHDHPEHIAAALKDVYKLAADHVEFVPTEEDEEEEEQEGKKSSVATGGWRHATPLPNDWHDQPGHDEDWYNEPPEGACPNCGSPNSHQGHDGQQECLDCGFAQPYSQHGLPMPYQASNESDLVTCPECGGDGKTAGATKCGKCRGAGKVPNFGDSMVDNAGADVKTSAGPYPHPDDPEGQSYQMYEDNPGLAQAVQRRFDGGGDLVHHPTDPNTLIHGPHNFWDGPRHLNFHPEYEGMLGNRNFYDPNASEELIGPTDERPAGWQGDYYGPGGYSVGPSGEFKPYSYYGSSRTADGANHNNTDLDGPEPKMDKGHKIPAVPDAGEKVHPTKKIDVVEPIKATNDSDPDQLGNIEKVKLPANSGDAGFDGGKEDFGPHTDTFGNDGQVDPVTSEVIASADDVYSNPLAKLMANDDDFPSDATVHAAFRRLR